MKFTNLFIVSYLHGVSMGLLAAMCITSGLELQAGQSLVTARYVAAMLVPHFRLTS